MVLSVEVQGQVVNHRIQIPRYRYVLCHTHKRRNSLQLRYVYHPVMSSPDASTSLLSVPGKSTRSVAPCPCASAAVATPCGLSSGRRPALRSRTFDPGTRAPREKPESFRKPPRTTSGLTSRSTGGHFDFESTRGGSRRGGFTAPAPCIFAWRASASIRLL